MAYCPTKEEKKTDEFQTLIDEVGEQKAVNIWKMNNGQTPEAEKIQYWVERYKTQEGAEAELNKAEQYEEIWNKLQNPGVEKLDNNEGYRNTRTNEIVSQRVSQLVAQYSRAVGTDYRGDPDEFYAQKGTVIHRYMEEMGKRIASGEDFSQVDVQKEVFKLMNLDQFEGRTEEFFRLKPAQFNSLRKGLTSLMDSVKNIQKTMVDGEGSVKFIFETPIIDETRDLAGTVDMIALFSDGSAAIYDFKSFSRKGQQPPGQTVQNKWNVQLSNYKNMLKTNYGISKFRQSRAIPIHTTYKSRTTDGQVKRLEEGFQSITMQNNENAEDFKHLDPVPVEELTGDKNLDRLIQKLLDEKKRTEALFQKAKPKNKARLLRKLTRLNNSLRNIQLNRDISGTINDIINLYGTYRERMHKGASEEGYMNNQELADALGELKIYSNIFSNYKNQLSHLPKDKRVKLRSDLETVESNVSKLIDDLLDVFETRVGEDVVEPGQHVGFLARNFSGIQDWNIPVFQKLYKLVSLAEEKSRRDTREEFKKIRKVADNFEKWANNNGYGNHEKFELIYNEKTGKLHRKFTDEFFQKRHEIREKAKKGEKVTQAEKTWLRKHFEFDHDRFEKQRDLQYDVIDHELELGYITEQEADKRKADYYQYNSIQADKNNFYSTYFLKPKEGANSEYLTKEWQFIQDNKPVKDYYDMYINYNKEWTEEFGYDTIGRHFVPNVKAGMFDQVIQNGPGGTPNMLNALRRQHQIHQQDQLQGVRDENGNRLADVPLLYTDPLRMDITEEEKNSIRSQVEADVGVTHEKGTEEFEAEVQRRIRERERELGVQAQSKDLTKSLMAMVYSANNHRHVSGIEGEVKLLQALLKNDRIAQKEVTDQDKTYVDKFTGELKKRMGMDPSYEQAFDQFVQMLVYGRQLQTDHEILGKYSMNKVGKTMMDYLSIRALGLNHTIQISDFIQGKTSLYLKAKEGVHYDQEGIKSAFNLYGKRDDQFRNAVEYFEPASRDIRSEEIELAGASGLSRRLTQRSLFIGYEWSDDNINNAILVAMAKRYVLDSDGQIKNPEIHEIQDENAPTVFESIERKGEGDQQTVTIEGLTIEEFNKFRRKVQKQANLIRGSTNQYQKGLINTTLLGQGVMQFKSWIPGMARERFQSLKYDQTMEAFEMGRFNAGFSELLGNGFKGALGQFLKIGGEVVSMGLYKKEINQAAVDRQYDTFLENNPEYTREDFPKEQFIKMKVGKLRAFAAELRIYLGLILTVQLLSSFDWDETDEEGSIFSWEAQNIVRRALLEASFWWNPQSVNEIVRKPIAMMGMAEELVKIVDNSIVEANYALRGIDDPRDESPFGYYMLKNTPVVTQVLDFFQFFNKYNPPKSAFDRIWEGDPEDDE